MEKTPTTAPPPDYSPPPPYPGDENKANDGTTAAKTTSTETKQGLHMLPVQYNHSTNTTVIQPQAAQPQVTTTMLNMGGSNGGNCPYCRTGNVVLERDTCWLITLIVMCFLTFPFGLFCLCLIPALTWERRCLACRHRVR